MQILEMSWKNIAKRVAWIIAFLAGVTSILTWYNSIGTAYTLHNRTVGSTLINVKPKLTASKDNHVCLAKSGTEVRLIDEFESFGSIEHFWQKVEVENGSCKGKVGWVAIENIVKI